MKTSNSVFGSTDGLKQRIPVLLASVFVLFTVLKSGASFNRIEAAGGSSELGEKLLMKPHNIQVLTLLLMFGCGSASDTPLESQLMQIRTGEGKSMILGAATTMLSLLGFRVRTVCYSEYLSNRDFKLFEEVFDRLGQKKYIVYSKITTFAEDSTSAKGDIRKLTETLLRGILPRIKSNPICIEKKLTSIKSIEGSTKELIGTFQSCNSITEIENASSNKSSALEVGSLCRNSQHSKLMTCLYGGQSFVQRERIPEPSLSDEKIIPQNHNDHECDPESDSLNLGRNTISELEVSTNVRTTELGLFDHEAMAHSPTDQPGNIRRLEVLLVDEVDVFFGPEFYGQTYNQVTEYKEPEIAEILKRIWNSYNQGERCLSLSDIQSMPEYVRLLKKLPNYLLSNEITLMLDQVQRVDDFPYHMDPDNDRIGYKVMDSISYDVTYGYATMFAYLKESDKLSKKETLSNALVMPISCGQFSYSNISPYRIIGVSGTLNALGDYEKSVLGQFGLNKYIYVPSVYGKSNFEFDKAGHGIYFEDNKSDFYYRILAEINSVIGHKRSVIVFFRDRSKLNEFVASPTYRQLGRHKKLLTEDTNPSDKEFIINKAATAGQITLCTAVFGRGTDFFCKDETVERNGGVHIIQTFLSTEVSEEIQIQGRTARQGKQGSYQMILLDSDLEHEFGVPVGERKNVAKKDLYDWLCDIRVRHHKKQCKIVQKNLLRATEVDSATHLYFDSLLAGDTSKALSNFESLYKMIKKPPFPSHLNLDIAFAIDVTGSMVPYTNSVLTTIKSLIQGQNSVIEKLKSTFPEIEFKMRVGCLGFRDIDDKNDQFRDFSFSDGSHFTASADELMSSVEVILKNASGGFDLAEDHLGAIHHCTTTWNKSQDWTSDIKWIMMFTDSPAHGFAPATLSGVANLDTYHIRHPNGLGVDHVASSLTTKDINMFFCSFDPAATAGTTDALSQALRGQPYRTNECSIVCIPMVKQDHNVSSMAAMMGGFERHVIFVLDESGSMQNDWTNVVNAYNKYLTKRRQMQSSEDLVSVVQFSDGARVTLHPTSLMMAPSALSYKGGGTNFHPAAISATQLAHQTLSTHTPTIVFMSDGQANDSGAAAQEYSTLSSHILSLTGKDLELHVIAFGHGTDTRQLQEIANGSNSGKVYMSSNAADLASVFVNIASNQDVATLVESEIAKRISEAVTDKLSIEYFGR